MSHPTLINLPPPPSDPATPSEMGPGTPNSGTTSMSELSTVAIKDGHRGHPHHHHSAHTSSAPLGGVQPSNTSLLDAERADRISRLAGLERLAAARPPSNASSMAPGASASHPAGGYFDAAGTLQPHAQTAQQAMAGHIKERSTVGSASATGSVGGEGRATWASGGSDAYDGSNTTGMSGEEQEIGEAETRSSDDGFSDEGNASLVGFGEGAGSTVSGPISGSRTPQRGSTGGLGKNYAPLAGVITEQQRRDPRAIDGMTYDSNMLDTAQATPPTAAGVSGRSGTITGTEVAEHIMGDRIDGDSDAAMSGVGQRADGAPDMGRFNFESGR